MTHAVPYSQHAELSGHRILAIPKTLLLGLFSLAMMGPLRLDVYNVVPMIGQISFVSLGALWILFLVFPTRIRRQTWLLLFFLPIIILFLTMIWAFRFTSEFGGDFSAVLLAQRWFFCWLLYPVGLALHENGISLRRLVKTVYITVALILAIFAFRQLTTNFAGMIAQGDEARFVRNDSFRGYRLYFAQYIFYAALYVSLAGALFNKAKRWRFLIAFILLAALYSQVYSRLQIAESILVITFSALAFGRGNLRFRFPRQILATLLFFALGLIAIPFVVDYLAEDRSSGVWRVTTLSRMLSEFPLRPWLGTGPGSTQSISLNDVFGTHFAPSDLGVIGIMFVFGLVGMAIDLFLLFKVWDAARRGIYRASGSYRYLRVSALWLALFYLIGSTSFALIWTPDSIVVASLILLFSEALNRQDRMLEYQGIGQNGSFEIRAIGKNRNDPHDL